MFHAQKDHIDLESSVEIAEGVHWVGFYDEQAGLHCNPYLIVDNDEAIVIDGGSRPDFATVMMKILQTGIAPNQIVALLYQHYDPDLCGSIPNFEDIIKRNDLKILSDSENLMFIRHYSVATRLHPISKMNHQYTFSSGRTLQFIKTPYSHSGGSIVTFDPQSGILFTSDLFGSLGLEWELFLNLKPECLGCASFAECPTSGRDSPMTRKQYVVLFLGPYFDATFWSQTIHSQIVLHNQKTDATYAVPSAQYPANTMADHSVKI